MPERSSREQPELKIPVRNGRFVTKLRSQFGFYLNLKHSSGTGHLVDRGSVTSENAKLGLSGGEYFGK